MIMKQNTFILSITTSDKDTSGFFKGINDGEFIGTSSKYDAAFFETKELAEAFMAYLKLMTTSVEMSVDSKDNVKIAVVDITRSIDSDELLKLYTARKRYASPTINSLTKIKLEAITKSLFETSTLTEDEQYAIVDVIDGAIYLGADSKMIEQIAKLLSVKVY